MDYCVRSSGGTGLADPEPRLLAGMVAGVEMAVIELRGRSGLELPEIFKAAEGAVPDLVRKGRAGPHQHERHFRPLPAGGFGLRLSETHDSSVRRNPTGLAMLPEDVQVISVDDHVIEHKRVGSTGCQPSTATPDHGSSNSRAESRPGSLRTGSSRPSA